VCVRTYAREGIRGYCRCYLMDATHKDNAYKKQLWMNTKQRLSNNHWVETHLRQTHMHRSSLYKPTISLVTCRDPFVHDLALSSVPSSIRPRSDPVLISGLVPDYSLQTSCVCGPLPQVIKLRIVLRTTTNGPWGTIQLTWLTIPRPILV